jgi:hypothetical protein
MSDKSCIDHRDLQASPCKSQIVYWFLLSAGVILTITGSGKILAAFGTAQALTVADPIDGLKFKYLLPVVGIAELVIAAVCIFPKTIRLAMVLVAWLSTNFALYRLGLWWIGWHKPCSCMGSLTDALHISPEAADNIMKIVLAYLLIGSYANLFWLWRQKKLDPPATPSVESTVSGA